MRVLLCSSADAKRSYLYKALRESLNSVEVADNLYYAVFLASQESFDAVILCASGAHAHDGLSEALASFTRLPEAPAVVIALTHATPADCARLLRAGADACFVQPWSVLEIQERMLALRRTAQAVAGPTLARLDPLTRDLVEEDRRISLTTREYLLVECLLRHANAPVAREQLIRYAWPEKGDVEPSSVNLVVSRLRRKFITHRARTQIETINRYGYQLELRAQPPGSPGAAGACP
ncbi:DNA-binding response OmpR family regulator [Paraburkholderia bannensis]|uniref:DNA-binding response OmpR family regulator n=1 Tax=Paraburkholderia bannensis TaxID=765414 RepID=A0A7W9U526_9BURK|nr:MULTISPECIES: response regulator transcription factor [Paraburkholderia]MBB3262175.1 DNA-binding response OmpR family regulator [Paraburkholderia sp. WP4_3_2]MBB6107152.1 DNA-binding response OmpR family regulator [Paraburkholderia bannensis]